MPQSMKRAKICIRRSNQGEQEVPDWQLGGASLIRRGVEMTWATMAPILPMAAERPWPVERYRVGKHSPGTTKVVVLGPQLKKNWEASVLVAFVEDTLQGRACLGKYVEREHGALAQMVEVEAKHTED